MNWSSSPLRFAVTIKDWFPDALLPLLGRLLGLIVAALAVQLIVPEAQALLASSP